MCFCQGRLKRNPSLFPRNKGTKSNFTCIAKCLPFFVFPFWIQTYWSRNEQLNKLIYFSVKSCIFIIFFSITLFSLYNAFLGFGVKSKGYMNNNNRFHVLLNDREFSLRLGWNLWMMMGYRKRNMTFLKQDEPLKPF